MSETATDRFIPEMTYGDRLRRARLSQGMDQQAFADAVQVDRALVARHERMDAPPQRNRRALAAQVELRFGVPTEWLLTGTVPAQRDGVTRQYQRPTTAVVAGLAAWRSA